MAGFGGFILCQVAGTYMLQAGPYNFSEVDDIAVIF